MSGINKKVKYLNLLPIILISFILFKIINSPNSVKTLLKIVSPFLWAVLIAYILNPILISLETDFKLKRIWSILIIYIALLGLLVLTLVIITPKIIDSITRIIDDIPNYIVTTQRWLAYQLDRLEYYDRYNVIIYLEQLLNNSMQHLSDSIGPLFDKTIAHAINITSAIISLTLGIIISAYFLKDKELFIKQCKRLIYAVLSTKKADNLINVCKEFNIVFSKYLVGKILDSLIIGILCFIGTLIIKAPFPLLISTIVGITNLIPYFGPVIGAVPAVIITLFYSPIKALWILIFILALQQFDGLYLGPKILGTKVGLSPFWVISAIIIGGGLFGVLGMFLAVPFAAIIKIILQRFIDSRLNDKKIKL